jgi:hypothetical protein
MELTLLEEIPMPRQKTPGEFASEFTERMGADYALVGQYVNGKTPIDVKHHVCGRIYSPTPKDLLAGKSTCRHCSPRWSGMSDPDAFRAEVATLTGGEYEAIGDYVKAMEPVRMRHNACGHEFSMNPTHFRRGRRCPKCGGTMRKSHEGFVAQVDAMVGDEYIVIGRYVNDETKITFRHSICGREYSASPGKFIAGRRCPLCAAVRRQSIVVKAIHKFLREQDVRFTEEYWDGRLRNPAGKAMRFDFFLPDFNLAVEYDGEQHFNGWLTGSIGVERRRDAAKNAYCIENGIKLLRVNIDHADSIETLVGAALRQGSETIESLGAYFFDGESVVNQTHYYTSQREDYFECK